jgi:hypothetical protein
MLLNQPWEAALREAPIDDILRVFSAVIYAVVRDGIVKLAILPHDYSMGTVTSDWQTVFSAQLAPESLTRIIGKTRRGRFKIFCRH